MEVISYLQENPNSTARTISSKLKLEKKIVNRILYLFENIFLAKNELEWFISQPEQFSEFLKMNEILISSVKTAKELSKEISLTKSQINKILYCKDLGYLQVDETNPPKWMLNK